MKSTQVVLFILIINTAIHSQNMFNTSSDLIEAEYNFAAEAEENGVRDSFLKFIADEGILFRPHPVNGKEFLSRQEKRPGLLLWYPSFSAVSKAGDLGFNTGPWEYKRTAQDESIAFGNFVTVWKKQTDGSWKFLMDLGNSNEKPIETIPELKASDYQPSNAGTEQNYSKESKEDLFNAEKMFSEISASKGLKSAYDKFTADESMYIRDDNLPFKGNEIIKFLGTLKTIQTWETLGGLVSSSDDLGYTYGKITQWKDSEMKNPDHSLYYMRCWYNDKGSWKILIDVATVIPEEKE